MVRMVIVMMVRMWDVGMGGNEEGVKVLDEASPLHSQGQLLTSHLVGGEEVILGHNDGSTGVPLIHTVR